ncbi:MAG TPA: zf-TFIIB domain-containing protein [Myxococcales bacterium]|nr:zf-TFIIB domain-containing protein [Myxococcales bacterium]
MRACPKCKTQTLAPLASGRSDDPEVVPPSRCTHCQGVWLPHEAIEQHLVPASVDSERAAPIADGLAGFCPRCKGLLVRARFEGSRPFHLDRCPACAGVWFDAGEWAAVASSEWLTHLDDLWDPAWRRRVREKKAHARHLEEIERALGPEILERLRAAVSALRNHPMRALGLSYLIGELRSPR